MPPLRITLEPPPVPAALYGSLKGFLKLPSALQYDIFSLVWSSWDSPSYRLCSLMPIWENPSLGLLLLSRHFNGLLHSLYWRDLEIKVHARFPIKNLGRMIQANETLRGFVRTIKVIETDLSPNLERFATELGKILSICEYSHLILQGLEDFQLSHTYFRSRNCLVSLTLELDVLEYPGGGATGQPFDKWAELLCVLLPQLEALHLSNLYFHTGQGGEVTGTVGSEENVVIHFPDCPHLRVFNFGRHLGYSPILLVKHILCSAAQSLRSVSLAKGSLWQEELDMLFDTIVMPAVWYLSIPFWKQDVPAQATLVNSVSTACPNLRHLCIQPSTYSCTPEEIEALKAVRWAPGLQWVETHAGAIPEALKAKITVLNIRMWM